MSTCLTKAATAKRKFDEQCAGWVKPQLGLFPAEGIGMQDGVLRQPGHSGSSGLGQKLMAPLVGVAAAWTRLTHAGGSSYFWTILQLVAGLAGFLVIYSWLANGASDGLWFWLFGVPIGTIATASALAFAVKYIMLGALIGFGWFTCFAGLTCGATGVLGFIWLCVVKLAEHGVQGAVAPK